ncbi:MAG: glycosyltransferase family 2 protein, partial [Verrucomicrobiota bacterium]
VTGTLLLLGGGVFGAVKWAENFATGESQAAGTIALAMLPVVLGFQLLLQALVLDVIDKPDEPLSNLMVSSLPARRGTG